MKKLLNISVIAALAILPLAANAVDLTPEELAHADPAANDNTTVATANYVKGAYRELGAAINTKQDKLSTDEMNAIRNVSTLDTRLGTAETNIDALKTAVGNATSGLTKDVADLKTAVGDENSGLTKDVADLQANKQDNLSETQLKAVNSGITSEKVTDYDKLVRDSEDFITKDVNDLTYYTTTANMNTLLDAKANASDTYTKTEVDSALNAKANASDTYTKENVDTKLADKQDKLLEAQLNAVNSGITAEKVASYEGLVTNSENYATKAGVTATINASNITVPVLTTWGDNTSTDMEASITAAAYTETAPVVEP